MTDREPLNRRVLLATIGAGVLLRILHIVTSLGTPDSLTWYKNAGTIQQAGVLGSYLLDRGLNHPPLALFFASFANSIAAVLRVEFVDVFRFLQTIADVVTTLLLARLGGQRAAAFFMLSPAVIFISGFHCQSDPLMVMFLVAAVVAAAERRPALTGLAVACAAGIKIVALVALPLLLLVFGGRSLMRFAGAFLAAALVIWLPATAVSGAAVWRNVFGYTGPLTGWGWLLLFGRSVRPFVFVALFGSLALLWVTEAWSRQRLANDPMRIARVVGLAILLMLFFAPGFGVQYLFWPLPFVALLVDRRIALAVHGVVSAWLFAVYTAWAGGWPWWFGNLRASLELVQAGLAVWGALGIVAVLTAASLIRGVAGGLSPTGRIAQ